MGKHHSLSGIQNFGHRGRILLVVWFSLGVVCSPSVPEPRRCHRRNTSWFFCKKHFLMTSLSQEVNCWHTRLTPDQAEAVCLAILQAEAEDLKLRKLFLRGTDLSSVPPAVLSGSILHSHWSRNFEAYSHWSRGS